MDITRRAFLSLASLASGALVTLPSLIARAKKLAIPLDKAEALQKVGGAITLKLKGRTVLFVRDAEDSVHAINPTCSHKQCTVEYKHEEKRFQCPCHASAFDLDGKVLGGPAPAGLEVYPASLADKRVIVTLPDE